MTSRWKQFRTQKVDTPEHRSSAGQFRVIGSDTFEGPFADFEVGDFVELDAAIAAAKEALSPMVTVYVYDDKDMVKFHEFMSGRTYNGGQKP